MKNKMIEWATVIVALEVGAYLATIIGTPISYTKLKHILNRLNEISTLQKEILSQLRGLYFHIDNALMEVVERTLVAHQIRFQGLLAAAEDELLNQGENASNETQINIDLLSDHLVRDFRDLLNDSEQTVNHLATYGPAAYVSVGIGASHLLALYKILGSPRARAEVNFTKMLRTAEGWSDPTNPSSVPATIKSTTTSLDHVRSEIGDYRRRHTLKRNVPVRSEDPREYCKAEIELRITGTIATGFDGEEFIVNKQCYREPGSRGGRTTSNKQVSGSPNRIRSIMKEIHGGSIKTNKGSWAELDYLNRKRSEYLSLLEAVAKQKDFYQHMDSLATSLQNTINNY